MNKAKLLTETILSEPSWRHLCFAEADAGDDAGGGAAPGVDAGGEAAPSDDISEFLDPDEGTGEPDADSFELEIGNKKIKVGKDVKEAWDGLQTKVQSSSEQAAAKEKAAETREREAHELFRLATNFADDIADIKAIDKQIAKFNQLTQKDWIDWGNQDPEGANKALVQFNAMKAERDKLATGLQGKLKDIETKEAATKAERLAQAERDLAAKVKDWTPEKREETRKALETAYGISQQEFSAIALDPRAVQIWQDALAFRKAKAKAEAAAAARKAQNEPEPEPVTRARSSAPTSLAAGMSDKASMSTFKKNFLAQRKQHLEKGRR